MDRNHDRRRFLGLAGAGAGLVLAGCAGTGPSPNAGDSESASSGRSEPTANARTDSTTTEPTEPTMNTVFHFSSGPDDQPHAIANVRNLHEDDSVDVGRIVLVANGRGVELLTTADSAVADAVATLQDAGVGFRACHNSMAALDVSRSDLLDGVEVVPSGVGELTRLQAHDGYAYIATP